MPRDLALAALRPTLSLAALTPAWRKPLGWTAAVWLLLILAFLSDWRTMAAQWWDSSTYNHVLLVPAILVWLVLQRTGELAKLVPRPSWHGAAALGLALLVWLLGAVSGFDLLRQAGAVGVLPASALLLLGPRVCWGLAFPLAYMAFLVPFGDELIPPLQTLTAKITIALTNLSGIPAKIDGVFIDTPAGLFVVAEACSGVKFLIAMIAFGALVANVCFRSWWRRAGFMALAVTVPILANGVRAWGTIYVAQFVGAERATGFDHIVYGWVFFAVVLALVLAAGWRFFDRAPDAAMIDGAALAANPWFARFERRGLAPALAVAGIAIAVLGTQHWARTANSLTAPVADRIELAAVPGWTRVDYRPTLAWQPRAGGASHRLLGSYRDAKGQTVDVFFALYAAQGEGREAGGFGEGALPSGGVWDWSANAPGSAEFRAEALVGNGTVTRLAQTSYRHGELVTGSNLQLKLAVIRDRLLLRARPTMLLIVATEDRPGHAAQAALAAFRRSTGPSGPWMDRMAQVR